MTPQLDIKTIGLALVFLAVSSFAGARAHPVQTSQEAPGHQHFHCHQNKSCHSHGHDASHH